MKKHYLHNVSFIDNHVKWQLAVQCMNKNDSFYGGCENPSFSYTDIRNGAAFPACYYILAYYTPESEYYRDPLMMQRTYAAVEFMINNQHPDGTIDAPDTNFHDAAECAYVVQALYPAIKVMEAKKTDSEHEIHVFSALKTFLDGIANGILAGGFHTPNHRWVISSACAILANLLNRNDCLNYMNQFLAEGIDYNENGEYSERSSSMYNAVCNRSLFYLAQELDMPELYDPIARNLTMQMMYFEPDGTLNTSNFIPTLDHKIKDFFITASAHTKRDFFDETTHYSAYLAMAMQTRNPDFICCANHLLDKLLAQSLMGNSQVIGAVEYFHLLLLEPENLALIENSEEGSLPVSYLRQYMNNSIVRYRNDNFTVTIISGIENFLKIQCGKHYVFVRAAGSFYSIGQFVPQKLEKSQDGFILSFHARAGYKRPLSYPQNTSEWNKMDHSLREDVMVQDFDVTCHVILGEDGVRLHFDVSGCEEVPFKIEFILEPDGKYSTDDIELRLVKNNYIYQKCRTAFYKYNDGKILSIRGGVESNRPHHTYGENMRGTLEAETCNATVAITSFSPCSADIELHFN